MNHMDYRPAWYEAAHAASEITDEPDEGPLSPAEVYVLVAIWALSGASTLSLIWWALS